MALASSALGRPYLALQRLTRRRHSRCRPHAGDRGRPRIWLIEEAELIEHNPLITLCSWS